MCSNADFCIRKRDNFSLKKSMLREIHQTPPKLGLGPALTYKLYLIQFASYFAPAMAVFVSKPALTIKRIPLKSNSIIIDLDGEREIWIKNLKSYLLSKPWHRQTACELLVC